MTDDREFRDDELRRRLQAADLPDTRAARSRTVAIARARARPKPARSMPLATVAMAAVLLLVVFIAATPPGRAAAEWVQEMIGLDDIEGGGVADAVAPAILAEGTSPSGSSFQIRAGLDAGSASCLIFVWSEVPVAEREALGPTVGRCGWGHSFDGPVAADAVFEQPGGAAEAGTAFTGLVDPAVDHLTAIDHGPTGDGPATENPVQVFQIPETPGAELGASDHQPAVGYFVAFLPPGIGDVATNSEAELTAYDADGNALGQVALGFTDMRVPISGDHGPRLIPCGGGHPTPFGDQCRLAAVETPLLDPELSRRLADAGLEVSPGTAADRAAASFDRNDATWMVIDEHARGQLGQYGTFVGGLAAGEESARPVYVVQVRVAGEMPQDDLAPLTPIGEPAIGYEPSDGFLFENFFIVDGVTGELLDQVRVPGV